MAAAADSAGSRRGGHLLPLLQARALSTVAARAALEPAGANGNAAVLTSPGVDELRWLAPVRGGDVISGEAIVEQARLSASKPDRGILTTSVRLWNQQKVDVLKMTTHAFVRVRPHA